ncbi:hypothetical protein KUTeg_023143 [Tegillarca granosa]|uniref:S1 motif domain-containing protein n=1 Tax=Tegillarca granosa TaxID=220873 RepID=A0ABQ9E706_TEGGR|nr:hypothetical protein KUTeg_023143 [Tegillarca granosa]
MECLVHKSQMSRARVDDPSEMLSVGEKIYCKVISVEDNKIGLSMKVVNQTTGKDEDPSNVQHRYCHFAQDCFHTKGGKVYELIPEEERKSLFKEPEKSEEESTKKKKKKKKKHKKDRHRHKKKRSSSSSSSKG